jgi:hypothetical protein
VAEAAPEPEVEVETQPAAPEAAAPEPPAAAEEAKADDDGVSLESILEDLKRREGRSE